MMTTPSGLFTSCAMPAASWPMLASFSDRTRASCVLASSSFEWASSRTVVRSVSMLCGRHIVGSARPT